MQNKICAKVIVHPCVKSIWDDVKHRTWVQVIAWRRPGIMSLAYPIMAEFINILLGGVYEEIDFILGNRHIVGILQKRPYPPCLRMADRAPFGKIPSIYSKQLTSTGISYSRFSSSRSSNGHAGIRSRVPIVQFTSPIPYWNIACGRNGTLINRCRCCYFRHSFHQLDPWTCVKHNSTVSTL